MKILLTLPLLVLLGCALAEEHSTSTSCINGHCIDCLDGVCRNRTVSSRAARGDVHIQSSSTSSSQSCHNGVCTGSNVNCHNGHCTYEKRAASDLPPCYPGCTNCIGPTGNQKCYDGRRRREAEEGSYSESCTINNGHKECKICRDGVCHTTNKRGCTGNGSEKECTEKREAEGGVSTSTSTNCDDSGCTVCVNGNCHREKRETEEVNTSSSTSCSSVNGHKSCTVCDNNGCHTTSKREQVCTICDCCCEPAPDHCKPMGGGRKRRELTEEGTTSYNCQSFNGVEKCTFCEDGVCHDDHKGHEHKRGAEDVTSSSKSCSTNNGHRVCKICNNGACYTTNKREADGVYSKNCVNGHCQECIDGVCHDVDSHKREAQDQSSSVNCINNVCTRCVNNHCESFNQ